MESDFPDPAPATLLVSDNLHPCRRCFNRGRKNVQCLGEFGAVARSTKRDAYGVGRHGCPFNCECFATDYRQSVSKKTRHEFRTGPLIRQ